MGFVNIQNTNFENGVTNRNAADIFGSMEQLDPTRYHSWMDDFDIFNLANDWTIVNPNGGAGTASLVTSANGGRVQINSDSGAGNDAGAQKNGRGFLFEAQQDRKAYFSCVAQIDEATLSRIAIGLQDPTNGEPEDPGAGVWFLKGPSSTEVQIVTAANPGEGVSGPAVGDISDATDFRLEYYWDGIDRVYYAFNGNPIGFIEPGSEMPLGATQILTPVFFVSNGVTAADYTLQVDYLFAAFQRV